MDQHSWMQDLGMIAAMMIAVGVAREQIRRMRDDVRDLWTAVNELRASASSLDSTVGRIGGIVDEMRRAR